jgi:hypothetical protein
VTDQFPSDVEALEPGAVHEAPPWRQLFVMAAAAFVTAIAILVIVVVSDRREDAHQREIDGCRNELVAETGDATADGNVAEWKIVGALAQGIADGVDIDRQDAIDLAQAGVDLKAANDRRQAFELDPSTEFC